MKALRHLVLALTLCLVLCLVTACGGSGEERRPLEEASPAENAQEADASEDSSSSDDKEEPEEAPEEPAVTVPQTVLLDRDGVVVTVKGLEEDDIWGLGLKLLIENNSEKNIAIHCDSLVVNGFMVNDFFSADVAAGKKANETLDLSSSDLRDAGIATIGEIAMRLRISDSDSYDTLFTTEELTVRSSAYGTFQQPIPDEGVVLLEQDGVRIVGKYLSDDLFGTGVMLFLENSSDRDLIISCDDVSVNGFMVDTLFSCTVNSGRMALDDILLSSSDLEENDIEAVEELELRFHFADPESYHILYEGEPITFAVQ